MGAATTGAAILLRPKTLPIRTTKNVSRCDHPRSQSDYVTGREYRDSITLDKRNRCVHFSLHPSKIVR
jgi:hypothetical protein